MNESLPAGAQPEDAAPPAALAAEVPLAPAETEYPLRFTGTGSEYFRIWIVNLLLTIVTLGIYSAWAKVRKLQYFYRNTRLDDAAFDFHGDPKKILLGRVIAVALFVAYNFAFEVSTTTALFAVAMAIALAPQLVRRAIRFKHANSSYRGLRFGFTGSNGDAYRELGPAVVLFTLPGALTVLTSPETGGSPWPVLAASAALLLLYPLLHMRFKRFHHAHARYASLASRFTADWDDFYRAYLPVVIIIFLWGALFALGFAAVVVVLGSLGREAGPLHFAAIAMSALLAYGVLIATIAPFLITRLQNMIWRHTQLGEIRFTSTLRIWPMVGLYLKNALLVALTLGLYWPWAAVAVAHRRLHAVAVVSPAPLADIVGRLEADRVSAAGDAAADVFGFDIGL